VAPVGESDAYVARLLDVVRPFIDAPVDRPRS
jgi:predicted alpha/beta superfamily hydrolase